MAPRQQVALEPTLTLVFAEHLDDAAGPGQVVVVIDRPQRGVPLLVRDLEDGVETVGGGLVGAEDPEVLRVGRDHIAQPGAENAGGLADGPSRSRDIDGVVAEVRENQVSAQEAAVRHGVGTHPRISLRRESGHGRPDRTRLVEQLLRPVGAHPVLEQLGVRERVAGVPKGNLVRTPVVLRRMSVDHLRAGPPLGCAQHDHRPGGTGVERARRRIRLDLRDLVEHLIQGVRESSVDFEGILTVEASGDEVRCVPVPAHQLQQLLFGDAGEHARIGDLVAVQVEDRQHHPVMLGIEELVRVPSGRQGPGLGFAVADDRSDQQVRIVECGPVGVGQRVAQLATLVDRPRGLRCHVAGDPPGEGELAEQRADAVLGARDRVVHLAVCAVQVGVGDHPGPSVTRPGDEEDIERTLPDDAVQVGVDEVEAGRGPPVAEQSRLDVVAGERFAQQRVVEQVDLPHRQVVRCTPPGVQSLQRRG